MIVSFLLLPQRGVTCVYLVLLITPHCRYRSQHSYTTYVACPYIAIDANVKSQEYLSFCGLLAKHADRKNCKPPILPSYTSYTINTSYYNQRNQQ